MVQEVLRRQLRRPGVRRAGDQGRGGGRILQQTWQGKFVLFIYMCTLQGAHKWPYIAQLFFWLNKFKKKTQKFRQALKEISDQGTTRKKSIQLELT